jgi:triphosphoribosyl-dephospho-CoA synthase
MTIEDAVRTACLLEVTARKVGNVHPLAAFADCDWEAFAASAEAVAPVLGGAAGRPLGETILRAVEATNAAVGRNTNLGMVLLLAPLAAASGGGAAPRREAVRRVLEETTVDDAKRLYEAIRLARPGGLGTAEREDVAVPPTVTLAEAMRLAADRDAVARQYDNGFDDVFAFARHFSATEPAGATGGSSASAECPSTHEPENSVAPPTTVFSPAWLPLERQIVTAHIEMIAAGLETLITRKCGPETAVEVQRRAAGVLDVIKVGGPDAERAFADFDAWLRADGNRRNPGTTADLIAASLFVAIREGRVACFEAGKVRGFAEDICRGAVVKRVPLAARPPVR